MNNSVIIKFIKRSMSLLIAFVIAFSSTVCNMDFKVLAAMQKEPFGIYINDLYAATEENLTFDYGVTLLPEVSGTNTAKIMWVAAQNYNGDSTDWNDWSEITESLLPGKYYIGFNDYLENQKLEDGDRFSFTIQTAKLDAPKNIKWNNFSLSWDEVNTASTTGAVSDLAESDAVIDTGSLGGYKVILCKGGEEKYSTTVNSTGFDFTDIITEQGYGTYTAKVTANSADTSKYTSSDAGTADYVYKDEIIPVINSFGAGNGENSGRLVANVSDAQTGISGYVFTTYSEVSEIQDEDWSVVEPDTESQTYTFEPTQTGTYYFYAKDAENNVVKSDAVKVTMIQYNNYYENGTKKTKQQALIGEETVVLYTGMSRPGYLLEGWYFSSDFTGSSVDSVTSSQHRDSGVIDVYAKWKKAGFVFAGNLGDEAFTYDGQARALEVIPDSSVTDYIEAAKDGSISYQWYKKQGDTFEAITGETSSVIEVKNVSDSGLYYVEVTISFTDEEEGAVSDKYSSNTSNVKITPIELTINVNSPNIEYLDEIPVYTSEIDGTYAQGEDKNIAGIDITYTCNYAKGSGIGSYAITAQASSKHDNYSFIINNGNLTVAEKNVGKDGSGVAVAFVENDVKYTYDGNSHKPEVTVKDSYLTGEVIDPDQYEIDYEDCVNAGEATVKVTFKGNYTGTKTIKYRISKADFKPEVNIDNWTFGNEPCEPVTLSNVSGGKETFYYYKKGEEASAATTVAPENAGDYYVYVKVDETANYNGQDSLLNGEGTAFTISKKVITIVTQSGTWEYDGNTHVAPEYNVLGEFVGTDDFKNIIITGSIVDVGTCDNSVEYTLTSSTIADNYDIRKELGILKIESTNLAAPANAAWDSEHPGRASWVAVTRDNLTVRYRVQLYRTSESGYEPVGDAVEVDTTYVDYLSIIKDDCKTQNSAQSYVFDIVAIPYGGASKSNYTESEKTAKSEKLGTVLVSVGCDRGIESVKINGESGPVYLVKDETATIESVLKTGYKYADTVWTTTSSYFTISDKKSGNTSIKVGNIPDEEGNAAVFTANSVDKIPVITGFSATPIDNNSKVMFSFGANDELNITGWIINQTSTAPEADSEEWVSVNSASVIVNTDLGSNVVAGKGTYYLWVKDSNGSVVGADSPINVYEIQFADGGGTGTMSSLLKVQNINVTLPELAYSKAGYYFKNWSGSTGIYVNGGIYVANKDDILTATWTDQAVSYSVQYFYMNTDGTYNDTCESEVNFNTHYSDIISADSEVIQAARTGFEIDKDKFEEANQASEITIYESGTIVKLYYKRIKYKITFSYILPKTGESISSESDILYGAMVTEKEKPEIPGYNFVGWIYGESGSKPETMPNKDITATGTYVAKEAEYIINYYVQNVDCGNLYTLLTEYSETKNCLHDNAITYKTDDAREITGFTVEGIVISRGAASGSDISGLTLSDSDTGDTSAVESDKLNINIYYTRNRHSITLNVWKGTRGVADNNVYTKTWDDIPYGYAFSSEEINTYKNYYETNFKDEYESDTEKGLSGFVLAQYTDWSTGTSPSVMPDGDVTISKDYVVASDSRYYVEVLTEGTDGKYSRIAKMVCYSSAGKYICYNPDSTAIDSLDNYITYNELKNNMPSLEHYQYNPKLSDPSNEEYTPDENGEGCISGYVTDVDVKGEEPITLRIYFERKTVTTKINYYYANEDGSNVVKMYTVTKSGKWGTTYPIEADAYYDGNTDERNSITTGYWSASDKGNVAAVSAGTTIIDGTDVNAYDFRNNVYAVSYDERHIENGVSRYTSKTFLTAEDFNSDYTAKFGYDSNSNYVNVYYIKVDTDKTYYIDVKYRTGGLHAINPGEDVQLTYTVGDKTYKVRLANEKDVLNGTIEEVTQEPEYPAGNELRKMRNPLSGEKTEKEGYSALTVTTEYGEDTYYINGDYIYITDTENHLFYGNRASINLGNAKGCRSGINNDAAIGYSDIVDYLNEYKSNDAYNSDVAREAAYIYNNGFGSVLYSLGESYSYVYTFAYTDTYSLTFSLNGDTRVNEEKYVYGKTFSLHDMENFANIHFTCPTGKRIALYQDAQCVTPVSNEYVIKGNTVIYCRYEKAIYDNMYFISYELPNAEDIGGESAYYVDKNNYLTAISEGVFDADPDVREEDIILTNEYGIQIQRKITTTTYYINGNLALVLVKVPGFANSEVSMDYTDYAMDGYYYDDTNANNTNNGYCLTEEVCLAAYYTRYKYTLTIDNNNEKINNSVTYTYAYGRNVELTKPVKNGYTFAGWDWTFSDTDLNWDSDITGFVMPAQDVKAVAMWTPAEFTGSITHYFQTETQTYDTAGLAKMLNSEGITINSCTIGMANSFISDDRISGGKIYYEDSVLIGASFEYDGKVLYFSSADEGQDYYEVDASDLIAMTNSMTEMSEDSIAVSKYIMPESNPFASIFSYTFTICSEDATIERLGSNDSFTANADMDIAYYYTRSNNNNIRAFGMATDNKAAGVTITGTGEHYYGENVTLSAVVSGGYDFIGWFKAENVLVRYEGNTKITYGEDLENHLGSDLSVYELDTEYDFADSLGTDKSYSFKVTGEGVYVAVVSPLSVDGTTAEIVCNSEDITYGNISSTDDNLSLSINFGNENVVVSGYQWYIKDGSEWKAIEGATSGSYNLDSASNAGTYTYKCEVSLVRSDNGRTAKIVTAPYDVIINKSDMKVKSESYSGVYDGLKHGIKIDIEKPVSSEDYIIYYSDEIITEETDLETLSTNAADYKQKDVKYDTINNEVLAYDVYYCICDTTGNYNNYIGYQTIKITPKNITVKASAGGYSYSKVYDKDTKVNGEISNVDSDKGRLANGLNGKTFYTIIGIVEADTVIENVTYIIDFEAEYNYSHVATATAVKLTQMKLVTVENENYVTNYNYIFNTDSTLTLSAYITPYPIETKWDENTTFVYDGTPHKPSVTIDDKDNIPDGAENIVLNTSGQQVNAGSYYASVTIDIKEGVTGVYSSDYKAKTEKQQYTIEQRELTITPSSADEDINKEYNGQNQTISNYSIDGLVTGEIVEYEPDTYRKIAGTTQVKASNVKVFTTDENGNKSKNVTDNYNIICPEQTLTIMKKPVTISGIAANDKVYDGNRAAVLDMNNAQLTGIIGDDEVNLTGSYLVGNFESPDVGVYTNRVEISIADGKTEEDLLNGADADNYIVDWDSDETIKKASASITKSLVSVKVNDVTEVYGETVEFTVEYNGFISPDTKDIVTGTPVFKVRKQGSADEFVPYTPDMGAGVYEIAVDISGVDAGNYTLKVDNQGEDYDTSGQTTALLTVQKRKISAVKSSETAVTKIYDATDEADMEESLDKISASSVMGNDKSGVISNESVTFDAYAANYNSPDVLSADTITVSGLVIVEGKDNYELVNNKVDINGSIKKKDLSITADSQNIFYGSPAKSFTAKFNGLADGDSIALSELKFTCDYDIGVAANRNCGEYIINVEYADNYSNGNYKVTFYSGKVYVDKKTVYVNGESYGITYHLHSIPQYGLKADEPYTGFVYGETIETAAGKTSSGEITFSCKDALGNNVTNASVPDEYEISMDLNGLTADNYVFVAKPGSLTISKYELTITGITVDEKVYDGTLHLADLNDISYSAIDYGENLREEDGDYLTEHGLICVETVNDTSDDVYNNKNVGTDRTVTLKIKLTGYLAERYTLTSDEVEIPNCVITKKALNIKAVNKVVNYGAAIPSYTVTYDGFVDGENKDNLDGTLLFTCSYTNTSDVGSYIITPYNYSSDNYQIGYTTGTVTVNQTSMNAKAPCWDTARPGTITWNASSSIGSVNPDRYIVKLYKNGTLAKDAVTVDAEDTLEYDFSEIIRQNGEGLYTVGVTVVPSEVNNEGYKNVKSGAEAKSTSSSTTAGRTLRAAKVEIVMADDDYSLAGVDGVTNPVYIKNTDKTEYIMIAGESDVSLGVTMKNSTGYTVKSITVDDAAAGYFTVTAGTKTNALHEAAISAKQGLTDSDISNATVTVTLEPVAATLITEMIQINVNYSEENFAFGYSEGVAPEYKIITGALNDNITTDGYTYRYTWEYRVVGGYYTALDVNSLNDTNKWATGFSANAYDVRCTVTATRKDNGLSVTGNSVQRLYIARKNIETSVIITGWEYGQSRKSPVVTSNPGDGAITYSYCIVNNGLEGTYTTSVPTEPGTYKVKAYIAQTTNYNEVTTEPCDFTITKAVFPAVDSYNITMVSSDTAPYGLIKWDAIETISENAGADSAGSVAPKYAVIFAKEIEQAEDAMELTDIDNSIAGSDIIKYADKYYEVLLVKAETDCLTECRYDFTSYIKEEGNYSCFIQTYPGEYTNNSNVTEFGSYSAQRAANESSLSLYSATLVFNGSIDVKHNGESVEKNSDDSVTLTYDGLNTTLEMNYDVGTASGIIYKWYKNGVLVQDSDSKVITLKNTADSGVYACEIYINGNKQYVSPYQTITINKRKLTIKADDAKKDYDGTALTKNSYKITNTLTDEGLAKPTGKEDEIVSISIEGSITNVGTTVNAASGAVIKVKGTGETVTANYDISYVDGTLEVKKVKPELTIQTENLDKTYDGVAVENPQIAYLGIETDDGDKTDLTENPSGASTVQYTYYRELSGGTYEVLSVAPKDAGTYKVVASAEEGNNYLAPDNDEITFVISKRKLTIKADDAKKDYDGTALTKNSYKITNTLTDEGLAKPTGKEDEIVSISIEGSITNVGTTANVASGAVIKVKETGETVTANYDISYVDGTLEVKKVKPELTIQTESLDKTYDGVAVENPQIAYLGIETAGGDKTDLTENPSGASTVQYTYYRELSGGTYEVLSVAPKDAGTYKVVVSAEEGSNYLAPDNDEITFVISKRKLTIKADDAKKDYDGTALTKNSYKITNTLTDEGLAKPAGKEDEIVSISIEGSITNVGTTANAASGAVIKVKGTGETVTANYDISYVNGTLEVKKVKPELTIQTESLDKTYDGVVVENPQIAYLGIETADGDKTDLTENPSGASTVQYTYYRELSGGTYEVLSVAPKDAGTYKVVVSAEEGSNYLAPDNDEITFVISKRKLTIKADDAKKDYDKTALTKNSYKITNTLSDEGLAKPAGKEDEIVSISIEGSITNVGTMANVASGAVIKVKGTGETVTDNYDIRYVDGTLKITEATAVFEITTENLDKIYDGATTDNPLISYTGVGGENLKTGENITIRYFKKNENGAYDIELFGAPKDAGEYKVTANAATVSNYNPVEEDSLEFVISKRKITIKADDAEKEYDGTALTKNTCTVTNTLPDEGLAKAALIADEISSISIVGSQTNAGKSANTPDNAVITVGSGGENVTDNYIITYSEGTLTVTGTDVLLSITAETLDKIYDGVEISEPEVSYKGINDIDLLENPEGASEINFKYYRKNADNVYELIDGAPKNAGEYKVVVYNTEYGNYKAASDELTFVISERNITLKADDADKVYDGFELVKDSYTIISSDVNEGLAAPEGRQPDVITSCTVSGSITDVGYEDNIITNVVIQVGDTEGEDVTDSYKITLEKGSLEIAKAIAVLTITDCDDKIYDGTTVVPLYNYSGDGRVTFVYMDENMQILENPPTAVGTYYVKAVSKDSHNYFEAESEIARFNISIAEFGTEDDPEEIENPNFDIKVGNADTCIYMGVGLQPEIEIEYLGQTLAEGVDYIIEYYDNIDEGTAYIKITGIGNFSGTIIRNFDIIKRKILIITESAEKIYDGTALVCDKFTTSKYFDEETGQYIEKSGLADNHTAIVNISGTRTNVGTSDNTIDSVKIVDRDGNDVTSNYELIYQLGTLSVKKTSNENGNGGTEDVPTADINNNVLMYWIFCMMSGSMIIFGRRKTRGNE